MSGVPEIRKGSKCRVRTTDGKETEGDFIGYTMMGSENALAIQTEDGVARFLIMANISYLDLMDQAPGGEDKDVFSRRADIYYG